MGKIYSLNTIFYQILHKNIYIKEMLETNFLKLK